VLFSGSNQTVALVRATDGSIVRHLHGHTGEVLAAVFSPDGQKIISTARDGVLYQWETSLTAVPRAATPKMAEHPVFDSSSCYLAASLGRQRLGIYDTQTWQEIASIRMQQEWPLAFSADGTQLITGRRHHSLRTWDWRAGKMIRELNLQTLPNEGGGCFVMSPDQRWVVGGTLGGLVVVWDAVTGQRLHGLPGYSEEPTHVQNLVFSPDSRWLISLGNDRQPRLWRVADWSLAHVLPLHGHACHHAAFSLDSQTLATSSYDGLVRLFDCTTGQLQRALRSDTNSPGDVTFMRDGHTLGFIQGEGSVLMIDTRTWRETVRLIPPTEVIRSNLSYNFLTLSPDGHLLIATDYDGKLSAEWRTR
jgi:WD40 repeat protein